MKVDRVESGNLEGRKRKREEGDGGIRKEGRMKKLRE